MSADSCWRVRLACNRIEAELLPFADDMFADMPTPPTLLTDEPDPDQPDDWLLDAYFAAEPTADQLARLQAAVPSSAGTPPLVELLADQDWVTMSQAGLAPVTAGRFHVHTMAHKHERRAGQIGLRIEAGLAFGTGQHNTTHGCLMMIDQLAKARSFGNVLDLGTGTAVLALGAMKRWRRAHFIGSDIDPVSVAVSAGNVRMNREKRGRGRGQIELVVAKGMHAGRLNARAPYDLIIANILAAPLIGMAGEVCAALAPGGFLLLAGLLNVQRQAVDAAYRGRGLVRVTQHCVGEWPTLVLRRPKSAFPNSEVVPENWTGC